MTGEPCDGVRCARCGFEYTNSAARVLVIRPGNYCPRCGRQFTDEDVI